MKHKILFLFNLPLILFYRTLFNLEFNKYNEEYYQHKIDLMYWYILEKDWLGITLISINMYCLILSKI